MGLFDFFQTKTKQPDWVSNLPKEIANMMLNEIKSNPQACNFDEIPQGKGRFGLDETNPVPVYGIPTNEIYLGRLKTKNGEKIRWRRIGSMQANNISSLIDKYEIFNVKGDTIAFIYISPYHLKISEKAPDGFKII